MSLLFSPSHCSSFGPLRKLFKKTGYFDALGLLIIIPFINLVLILLRAFAEWPIQISEE